MSMSQKDLEIIAKKSNMSTDEVEKIFENAKNIWTKIANIVINLMYLAIQVLSLIAFIGFILIMIVCILDIF